MARSRTNRSPALAASAALHAAVAALAILAWQWGSKTPNIGEVVPVEIINGPPSEAAPAARAPEPTPATTEQLNPEETQPAAVPTPPTPQLPVQPKQAPAPQPPPGKPTAQASAKPALPGLGKPAKGLNLDQLANSIVNAKPQKRAKPFSLTDLEASLRGGKGSKGPARPQAASETGQGTTDHASASSIAGLGKRLGQMWNTNCDVEGASDVNVQVRVHVAPGGTLARAPELVDRSIDPLKADLRGAAAHRALAAVVRGAPFFELPPNFAGDIVFTFDAKQSCARR